MSTNVILVFAALSLLELAPGALSANASAERPTRTSSSPSSAVNIAYTVEFQILEYANHEGRLMSGDCCSGYKSALGRGLCRGGNSTCSPYWKICLTQQQPVDNQTLVMPTQRRTDPNRPSMSSTSRTRHRVSSSNRIRHKNKLSRQGSVPVTTTTTSTTTTRAPSSRADTTSAPGASVQKPSYFKNFLNRILGGLKAVQSLSDYAAGGETIKVASAQTSACSIAFWTTEVIKAANHSEDRLTLRAAIPRSVMNRYRTSSGSGPRRPGESSRDTPDKLGITQKVLVFVEIWHKESTGPNDASVDKLMARHLEQRVTTVQLPTPEDNFWELGGQEAQNNQSAGVEFKYRWRLLGEYEKVTGPPVPEVETTTAMVCPDGFQGSDCKEAVCSPGCDTSHGYCESPGDCKCKFGWTGEYCSLCIPMPGCVHGSCIKPFECRCEDGWSGMFCDKPTCKSGCHPQNGFCEHPGECGCRFGYQGENCTECATMPGCQNGGCEQPLDCNCYQGWKGLFCSIPVCSEGCDLDHGWCRRPDECRCRVGWLGQNCTECAPYPGCENGSCNDPWTCNCEPSWGGVTCSEKLDYCENSSNPCQNGGTCISVEKADGRYLCQCPLGYEGRHCEGIKI